MNQPIIALGIDPGLAKTGIAGVARFPDGTYRSLGVRVSRTDPTRDKSFGRASVDDQRRYREHWVQVRNAIELIKPDAIGIESYSTFEPRDVIELREAATKVLGFLGTSVPSVDDLRRALGDTIFLTRFAGVLTELAAALNTSGKGIGLGQAAKTIAVFGGACTSGYSAGRPVFEFRPSDIKKFGGRRGASKDEVGAGLENLVVGLKEQMAAKVPQKTLREHAWDATGHAILAADEYAAYRLGALGSAVGM